MVLTSGKRLAAGSSLFFAVAFMSIGFGVALVTIIFSTHINLLPVLHQSHYQVDIISVLVANMGLLLLSSVACYFVVDGKCLTELSCPLVEDLTIEFESTEKKQCEDVSWIMKSEMCRLKELGRRINM